MSVVFIVHLSFDETRKKHHMMSIQPLHLLFYLRIMKLITKERYKLEAP
jgi:hypothetical protein